MQKAFKNIAGFILIALLLNGCGTADKQTGDQADLSEPIHAQSQTPPTLELKIGNDVVSTFRGGYSWSYYDPEEKSMAGIEAESVPLDELVNLDNARKVDRNAAVELEFGEPPLSYQLFVWDDTGSRTAYSVAFNLSEHEGPTLFEISAQWEQGEASYAFALHVE